MASTTPSSVSLETLQPAAQAAIEQPAAVIFDIRRFSIHDGPGIRTAVFFKGCPLRCQWCHNPESQSLQPELILRLNRCIHCEACVQACPHAAVSSDGGQILTDREKCQVCGACADACYAEGRQLIGRSYSLAEVLDSVERDRVFFDQSGGGLTLTGGEPLMQLPFARLLLQAARRRGVHTVVETCGFASWTAIQSILESVDLFLYDLKLMDDGRHRQYTGVSNRRILDNLGRLVAHGKQVIARIPVIPGVNDDAENLAAAGSFLAGLGGIQRVDLLPYHSIAETKYQNLGKEYLLKGLKSPGAQHMQAMQEQLRAYGLEVTIGG